MTRPSDIIVICHPWVNLDGKFAVKIDVFPLNKYSILTSSRSSDQPSQPNMVSVKHKIDLSTAENAGPDKGILRKTWEKVILAETQLELISTLVDRNLGFAARTRLRDRSDRDIDQIIGMFENIDDDDIDCEVEESSPLAKFRHGKLNN